MPDVLEALVDYSRQREMDNDLNYIHQCDHCVVGVGGIGYWLALQLAMLGAQKIVLIDGDKIEASNLNRVPAPMRHLGEWKVKSLKAQLRLLRPRLHVTCIPVHITEDTLEILRNTTQNVLWDCTDDARIQRIVSSFAKRTLGCRYIKAGYEGWNIGMYSKMEDTWLQDGYAPGYASSRANVISSMMAAGLAIMYAGRTFGRTAGTAADVHVDLKKLVEQGNTQEVA